MKARFLMWLLIAAGAAACDLPTPAAPSYARDVRPIFLSHCIRCHGAGGTLQGDPPEDEYPLGETPTGYKPGPPRTCYLNSYEDQDCVAPDGGAVPATCKQGAHSCAALVYPYISGPKPLMPPPPAHALTDWEKEVIHRWSMNPLP